MAANSSILNLLRCIYRALCIMYYLDQPNAQYINNFYFLEYTYMFRCIYIIFRESFLMYPKVKK